MSTALFIAFKLAGFDSRTPNLFSQGVSVVGCPVGRINVFFTDKSGGPRHHSVAPFLLQLETLILAVSEQKTTPLFESHNLLSTVQQL